MNIKPLTAIMALSLSMAVAEAKPLVPASEDEPLERLPVTLGNPALRALRAAHEQLRAEPTNLALALRIAQGYLDLGRASGDPRYAGYAQAALAPWWDQDFPPNDVLLLRAAMRQRAHLFDGALQDLDHVLVREPRNARARLMRATVLQVNGALTAAGRDCVLLGALGQSLAQAACAANVAAASGSGAEAYEVLSGALDAFKASDPSLRSWALTMLAEIAWRLDMRAEAERRFREALALAPDDAYTLSAFADFLLNGNRPAEVETLLAGRERVDSLLLRLAIAAKNAHAPVLGERVAQLNERFEAAHRRGDAVHLREEARFTLALLGEPAKALELALENWRVQKETADLRILAEAAIAAGDRSALDIARDWMKRTRLQDRHLEKIFASAHPN